MKTFTYTISIVICLIFGGILQAQETQVALDPLKDVYRIGGSSELFISYANDEKKHSEHGILNVSPMLDQIPSIEIPRRLNFLDRRKTASAKGDFNGDGSHNIVTIINKSESIWLRIPLIGEDLKINGVREYDLSLKEKDYKRIRIIAGNFDSDPQQEIAICYDRGGRLVVRLFKTNSDLKINEIANFESISSNDINFDIAAGDLDGNGICEIALVNNKAKPAYKAGTKQSIFISTYDLHILKYDQDSDKLISYTKSQFEINNIAPESKFYAKEVAIINEMRVTCGDLNNNGKDDIVVGWSYFYCHYTSNVWKRRYYFYNITFLNTFKLNNKGSLENNHNTYVAAIDFHENGPSPDQHIAMTLECEKMKNVGKATILINCVNEIHVYEVEEKGSKNMLKKIGIIKPSNGQQLNIQGNEAFVVADFNPDISANNFNKEVIILKSDKTPYLQYKDRYNGKVSLEIASIKTLTADTIVFEGSTDFNIPFNNNGTKMELSAFIAGDFDVNDAEVFYVGAPVIIDVSDLIQPIVVLNSPPIHFDIIDGSPFDLSNAFTEDISLFPSFAQYSTTIKEQKSTRVDIDNSYGVSSEFNKYAFAGGSGFEAGVTTNFNKGRSFYNSNTHNKTVEESNPIVLEDHVFYSSMDYRYYLYPIYDRESKKIGDIVVLNPVSEDLKSKWESANSWAHPSYVFNHEPGNLLSYKQRKNLSDFSSTPSDFIFHEFSKVPVYLHSGTQFKFTINHITSHANSYSFSAGIGASLFMKKGIEATIESSLAPLGLGGSLQTDIRIGVSANLSANYHTSTLSTHSTEFSNTFMIEGKLPGLAQKYNATARYYVTPYIYRSQSGALVLDYIVEFDRDNMEWWEKHYGKNPDLAFILPWRYATEKGNKDVTISKKQKTNDIQFFPPIASPGDTVVIIARVHNFSLKTFNDLLEVDYYLGDPNDSGIKLIDIYGTKGSSKYSTMIYGDLNKDREEYLTFIWKVPDTISCSPRIYALIDPDNVFEEIHKSNNLGWNLLHIYNCIECKYQEIITHTENDVVQKPNFKVFPNPFSSYGQIRFSLPKPEIVQIDLYNFSGHKVATLASEWYSNGEHEVVFNAENLNNGIYFCRVLAGDYNEVIKLVLVR